MLFDDRLATVLRTPARSEAAARTQYRQLLDLLGSMPEAAGALAEGAYERLEALEDELPAAVQSQILRLPGLRLRSVSLVAWLAQREPQAAAAAMATAQLGESEWLGLIPRLPVTARGFLRHRRDLPPPVRLMLERLGVTDLVLPEPPPAEDQLAEAEPGIAALVRRIEAFQQARRDGNAPRLPLEEQRDHGRSAQGDRFDFATDAHGTIVWADPAVAALTVGMTLAGAHPGAVARLDETSALSLARRLPVVGGQATLSGPAAIAGPWRVDATPAFAPVGGAYLGHRGRMRRSARPTSPPEVYTTGDRMRQVLHELRTPVNAIQGFAEIIQQQLFGPAPHEYRALAGGVAVDAARLMAGFDELDRLAKLESAALTLDEGASDLREVLTQLLRRLEGVLRPRSARMELTVAGSSFTLGIDESETSRIAWRLLATLAGAMAPGEVLELDLKGDADRIILRADLPAALLEDADMFAASAPAQPRAVSAGMFGSGFAFRLARAEAVAAGGSLARDADAMTLILPTLTGPHAVHSVEQQR